MVGSSLSVQPLPALAAAAKTIVGSAVACVLLHILLKEVVLPAAFGQEKWNEGVDAKTREAVVHDAVTSFVMSPLLVWLYCVSVR
jgi:hypothetical protein